MSSTEAGLTSSIHIIPGVYFFISLIIYALANYAKFRKSNIIAIIGFLYFTWAVLLGFRYIFDGDPGILYHRVTELSIQEIWDLSFPKVDILMLLIMKLYANISTNYQFIMLFSEITLIGLIFIAIGTITNFNANSLLLTFAYLVFTNSGILIIGNFLRQSLATGVFLNILHLARFTNKSPLQRVRYLRLIPLAIVQFFSHISSVTVLFVLYAVHNISLKRSLKILTNPGVKFRSSSILFSLVTMPALVGLSLYLVGSAGEVYGDYSVQLEEESQKLAAKLSIDAVIIFLLTVARFFWLKKSNYNFDLITKVCIGLFLICLFYSPFAPAAALRLEYYLNFLCMISLVSLAGNEQASKKKRSVMVLVSLVVMYWYSFAVYSHPSVLRTLNYNAPQEVRFKGY